jgi:hypothetical protein
MSLTKRSIDILLDLVEIKISYMDISDREDARDLQLLERCRAELSELKGTERGESAAVVPFAGAVPRAQRSRATASARQPVTPTRQPLSR